MRRQGTKVLVFVFLTGGVLSHAQNLVQNGDFEAPGFSTPPYYRYLTGTNSNSVTAWTVIDDGVGEPAYYSKLPDYPDHTHHGLYGFALNQGSRIRTDFPTFTNARYQLSFWTHVSDCSNCLLPKPLQVKAAGLTVSVPPLIGWHSWTFEFDSQESNPSATLEFFEQSGAGDFTGYGLDDVAIAKVGPPRLSVETYPILRLDGIVGGSYRIEATEALTGSNQWKLISEIVFNRVSYEFIDLEARQSPGRFYRAIQLR